MPRSAELHATPHRKLVEQIAATQNGVAMHVRCQRGEFFGHWSLCGTYTGKILNQATKALWVTQTEAGEVLVNLANRLSGYKKPLPEPFISFGPSKNELRDVARLRSTLLTRTESGHDWIKRAPEGALAEWLATERFIAAMTPSNLDEIATWESEGGQCHGATA